MVLVLARQDHLMDDREVDRRRTLSSALVVLREEVVASSLHSQERLLNRRPLVTFQQRVGKISQRLFENVLTSVKSLLLPQLPSFCSSSS